MPAAARSRTAGRPRATSPTRWPEAPRQERVVETAAHAAGEVAVEADQVGGPRAVPAVGAEAADMDDPRFGQGAGLVRAQDIHGAQIMDRRQALHHDRPAASRMAPRAGLTVITIGSSSGVSPTASARANRKLSSDRL